MAENAALVLNCPVCGIETVWASLPRHLWSHHDNLMSMYVGQYVCRCGYLGTEGAMWLHLATLPDLADHFTTAVLGGD